MAFGVERAVAHLRARGHAVSLLRPRQRGEAARHDATEWRTAGAPIPMYPALRVGWASVGALARHFAAERSELVHIATQGALGRNALVAARRIGLPVTTDFRTNFHAYTKHYRLGWSEPIVWRYLRHFHNRADCSFVPTRALLQAMGAQGFQRLEAVGRGVDAALYSPLRRSTALRASWGAHGDEPVLLHVGRLAPEKNVLLALQAHAALASHRPGLKMVVVGDGPERRSLEQRFPQVRFTGQLRGEALARHYASADLFLFPSQSETFGNVTLEAMASGLAVLAFDMAAAAEHIRDGDNGLVVPPGDDYAFVIRALQAVTHGHAAPRAPLRRRAREEALRSDWDSVLGRFEHRLAHHAALRGSPAVPDVALA